MYQAFFDLQTSLCKKFPALTPFSIRREKYGEVMRLYGRLLDQMSREEATVKDDKGKPIEKDAIIVTKKNGEKIIMRPAKNDDRW
jgi:hypothetical protein